MLNLKEIFWKIYVLHAVHVSSMFYHESSVQLKRLVSLLHVGWKHSWTYVHEPPRDKTRRGLTLFCDHFKVVFTFDLTVVKLSFQFTDPGSSGPVRSHTHTHTHTHFRLFHCHWNKHCTLTSQFDRVQQRFKNKVVKKYLTPSEILRNGGYYITNSLVT
jgi:hypothetical protein